MGGEFFAELPPQGKLFFTVQPLGVFVVDDRAFGAEHIMEHGTAPAGMLGGQFLEPISHRGIGRGLRLILQAGTVPAREAAGAPLRQPKALNSGMHGRTSGFGRQNFFASRSLRTIMSTA